MNVETLNNLNAQFAQASASELINWAVNQGDAIVTTNFRPYEAVILHLATKEKPDIPVLWVDHGANLPETYRFAEKAKTILALNLRPFLPLMTSAHWLALNDGQIPLPDEIEKVESFSRIMKLEPFQRGMRELAPAVWITALRREQNPYRAVTLQRIMWDEKFNCLKVNPILEWTHVELDHYLNEHSLPNERTYYDPAKGDEKHECGLHGNLVTEKE